MYFFSTIILFMCTTKPIFCHQNLTNLSDFSHKNKENRGGRDHIGYYKCKQCGTRFQVYPFRCQICNHREFKHYKEKLKSFS